MEESEIRTPVNFDEAKLTGPANYSLKSTDIGLFDSLYSTKVREE